MLLSSRDLAQVLFGTWFLLTEVEMLAGRPVCTVIFTRVTEVSTDLCSTTFRKGDQFEVSHSCPRNLLCLFPSLCASASNAALV